MERLVTATLVVLGAGLIDIAWPQLRFWHDWSRRSTRIAGVVYLLVLVSIGIGSALVWPHVGPSHPHFAANVGLGAARGAAATGALRASFASAGDLTKQQSILIRARLKLQEVLDSQAAEAVRSAVWELEPNALRTLALRLLHDALTESRLSDDRKLILSEITKTVDLLDSPPEAPSSTTRDRVIALASPVQAEVLAQNRTRAYVHGP